LRRGLRGCECMSLPDSWVEEAYAAMLRVLRKRFGERDLIYEAAAERLLEVWPRFGPSVAGEGELVGLCLKFVERRAIDMLRRQGWLWSRREPLGEVADRRAGPAEDDVKGLLRAQESCLLRLPSRWRALLEMYYLQGRSDRVIARVLEGLGDREIAREDRLINECTTARKGRHVEAFRAAKARQRAIEAARKAVSRERQAALRQLRRLVEAEVAGADRPGD